MEKNKLLVVGTNGFLGNSVKNIIEKENIFELYEITGKDQLDLRNYDKVYSYFKDNNFNFVINCSAFVGGIAFGYDFPAELLEINTTFANNLYRASMQSGVNLLVNPISNCAYPSNINYYEEEKFWDGAPHESVFNYGLSKRHMVALGESYKNQYNFSSANIVLSNMYGPNDHFDESRSHALGALVKKICDAKRNNLKDVEIWGTGKPIREWLFVEDGANALIKALKLTEDSFFFNIGVGKGISIKELAEIIAFHADWDGSFIYNTNKPDGVLEKTVNGKVGEELLDWKPSVSLDTGIKLTVEWYFNNGKKE